jgi:hypothetical protein
MNVTKLGRSFRALSLPLSLALALGTLACSGESDSDGDDHEDNGGTGGSGGSSSTGGSSGTGGLPPECQAEFMPIDPTAVIDDMEDGNPLIAEVGQRNGSWWVSSDGSAGTITPVSDAAPTPERILGKRCESEFAQRMTGQGFTDWGANLSASFRYVAELEPIDASDFSGVMFWARVGETHNSDVRVQFQDSNTHPNGGVCDPTPGTADECYNGWGTQVTPISTEWHLYKIPFSRMAQRDFGHLADAIDTTALYGIEWNVDPGTVFDLWIDDVWFYE